MNGTLEKILHGYAAEARRRGWDEACQRALHVKPKPQRPWDDAYMRGFDDAMSQIRYAIRESIHPERQDEPS